MPPLTTIPRQPSGQLGRIQTVTPRSQVVSTLPEAQVQAARAGIQAAGIRSDTASIHAETGVALSRMGAELLKPLEDLQKSREVLKAQDIAVSGILDARRRIAGLSTSGRPHGEHLAIADAEFAQAEQIALQAARGLGPAGMEYVTRTLAGEKLRLFESVQQEVIETEVNEQVGALSRLDEFSRQEMQAAFNNPARQAEVQSQLLQAYDTAVNHRLITPEVREKRLTDFSKDMTHNTAINIAKRDGYLAARDYVESPAVATVLGAADQQKALNAAEDAVRYDVKRSEAAHKEAEKRLELAQDYQGSILRQRITDKNATAQSLSDLAASLPGLVLSRDLKKSDADVIHKDIERRLDEITAPGTTKDNPDDFHAVIAAIALHPEEVTERMVMEWPGLIGTTRQNVLNYLTSRRQSNHYSNREAYKHHVAEIGAQPIPEGINVENLGEVQAYEREVQRTLTAYQRRVAELAGESGILSEEAIQKLDPYVDALIEQLEGSITPANVPSLDSFR